MKRWKLDLLDAESKYVAAQMRVGVVMLVGIWGFVKNKLVDWKNNRR